MRDLFGEIPVTWPEVWDWLENVAGIARESWRARYYLENWDVPAKIRAAKAAGTFEAALAEPRAGGFLPFQLRRARVATAHRAGVRPARSAERIEPVMSRQDSGIQPAQLHTHRRAKSGPRTHERKRARCERDQNRLGDCQHRRRRRA